MTLSRSEAFFNRMYPWKLSPHSQPIHSQWCFSIVEKEITTSWYKELFSECLHKLLLSSWAKCDYKVAFSYRTFITKYSTSKTPWNKHGFRIDQFTWIAANNIDTHCLEEKWIRKNHFRTLTDIIIKRVLSPYRIRTTVDDSISSGKPSAMARNRSKNDLMCLSFLSANVINSINHTQSINFFIMTIKAQLKCNPGK